MHFSAPSFACGARCLRSMHTMYITPARCLCCRYGSGTEDQPDQRGSNLPERPEFPPPSLNLVPAFATDLPHKQGSNMLTVCAFLNSFSDLLGLPPVTLDNLLSAGQCTCGCCHAVRLELCCCALFVAETSCPGASCVIQAQPLYESPDGCRLTIFALLLSACLSAHAAEL